MVLLHEIKKELEQEIPPDPEQLKRATRHLQTVIIVLARFLAKEIEHQDYIEAWLTQQLTPADWELVRPIWKEYTQGSITKRAFFKRGTFKIGISFLKVLDKLDQKLNDLARINKSFL